MSPQKNAWQIHSDHQQIQIISIVKSKEDCLKPRVLLQKNRDRRPAAQARLARRTQKPTCFTCLLIYFPTGKTGAKTAASTLYRSSKLRLAAFMTEGGLAAVVAAAAKTRGIGCKGDLVRVFLFRSHVVTRQKFSRHTLPTPGGQVEITPYFLETRMQSGRRTV